MYSTRPVGAVDAGDAIGVGLGVGVAGAVTVTEWRTDAVVTFPSPTVSPTT